MDEDSLPGTSGLQSYSLPPITTSDPRVPIRTEKTPLEKAWDDLVEKVSVAGWKEALSEKQPVIRVLFACFLCFFSICSFYYIEKRVTAWSKTGYKDDVSDFSDLETLPFSNVTICAEINFNQTFIQSNLTVSPRIIARSGLNPEEFYRLLTLFLTIIIRPRPFPRSLLHLFSLVLRDNPQLSDFSNFAASASLSCEHMLKKCWFNGVEFDCCSKAIESFDEDGVCYLLMLNFDSDNAMPSPETVQQSTPGPAGGLSIEASVPLKDFPFLEDTLDNGFRVYVNPIPNSAIQSPALAPDKAETYIKVIPSMHKLATNCAPHGHLKMPGGEFLYYDPEGNTCAARGLYSMIHEYLGCDIISYLYKPNSSVVCNPAATYAMTQAITATDALEELQVEDAAGKAAMSKFISALEEKVHAVSSVKSRCPQHCAHWTYSSMASFSYLENDHSDRNTMYSRIHIYYAEFGYRQYDQRPESSLYLLFCSIGCVVAVYWGMSTVSFFHVFFYVPRYFIVRWRSRVRTTAIRSLIKSTAKVWPTNEDL